MAIINLKITDNKIDNLNEVITSIKNNQADLNTIEYLRTLKNNLEAQNITNKEELIAAINSKILEFEMQQEQAKDNLTTLRMLQETNEEFKKINIVKSTPNQNDSNRYIDYITFMNEDGTLEVLCCQGENTINDFIQSHKDTIETYSAQELFHHFKEYIHESLDFQSTENYDNDLNQQSKSDENDSLLEKEEYQMMEDYRNKYSIPEKVEVSVDQFGERLYRLSDGLFTFKTIEGKRVLETLKPPSLNKELSNDDLLKELDESKDFDANNTSIAIDSLTPEEENMKEDVSTYESLPLIGEDSFNFEDLQDITQEKMENIGNPNYTTSNDKEYRLNVYTKYLLNQMALEIEYQDITCPSADILEGLMECQLDSLPPLTERYDSNPQELSELDRKFVEKYRENKQKLKKLREVSNQKKLVLEQKQKNQETSGISTVIMLLEIITIAAFVIILLRLDI